MILASTITYELSKRLGKAKATELMHRHAAGLVAPGESALPCIEVIRELRNYGETAMLLDAGGTSIGHARSRAFSVALEGNVEFWVSIDDDVACSAETVRHLMSALDPEVPQIVTVPCLLRQETQCANVTMDPAGKLDRITRTGAHLRRALYSGFGIVAVTNAALHELKRMWESSLGYIDDDGSKRIALFCEFIRNGWWFRDDYAFFDRVPSSVRVEALCSGETDHAGYRLVLELLENVPQIPRPPMLSAEEHVVRRPYEPPSIAGPFPASFDEAGNLWLPDGRKDGGPNSG